jgi:5-formyltetrahydrofolate cyclo-ligase
MAGATGGDEETKMTGEKNALRARIRAALKKMTPERRATESVQACARLTQQAVWQKAQSVLFYAPLPGELDLWPLLMDALAAGKTVSLPRFEAEQKGYVACHIRDTAGDLSEGQYGIREPGESCERISLNRLDLILVPGIAFDLNGYRLGRGKGYYDRLLAEAGGPTCGVAFDEQIVSQIPTEPHDVRLNCILTPTRWQCAAGPRAVLK